MNRKDRNNVFVLVALLVLPLMLQTLHFIHVHGSISHTTHCHDGHQHHDETTSDETDHKECLICDFEFSLFSSEINFLNTKTNHFSYEVIVQLIEKQYIAEMYLLQPLRGPPYTA